MRIRKHFKLISKKKKEKRKRKRKTLKKTSIGVYIANNDWVKDVSELEYFE
jgi:hypothetical protein